MLNAIFYKSFSTNLLVDNWVCIGQLSTCRQRPAQIDIMGGDKMRKYLLSAVAVSAVIAGSTTAIADEAAAQKW
ncbi:MAG: hypothetical protein HOL57_07975, partial [Marinovum sp.]|nr:hypothetical protein [Marinovum sp.]